MSLKQLRKKSGFKVEHIAKEIGKSRQAYHDYESCKYKPDFYVMSKLAKLFNVDLKEVEKSVKGGE